MAAAPHVLVLGAQSLGRTVAEHMIALGWTATGVARRRRTPPTASPAAGCRGRPHGSRAAAQAWSSRRALSTWRSTPISPKGRFGGGDLITTDDERWRPTSSSCYRRCSASTGSWAARWPRAVGGTIVQVTGGSARRALPGRAPWAPARRPPARSSRRRPTSCKPAACTPACWSATARSVEPGDDARRREDRHRRAGEVGPLHPRPGPLRLDARAGGDAGRRPLDALAGGPAEAPPPSNPQPVVAGIVAVAAARRAT